MIPPTLHGFRLLFPRVEMPRPKITLKAPLSPSESLLIAHARFSESATILLLSRKGRRTSKLASACRGARHCRSCACTRPPPYRDCRAPVRLRPRRPRDPFSRPIAERERGSRERCKSPPPRRAALWHRGIANRLSFEPGKIGWLARPRPRSLASLGSHASADERALHVQPTVFMRPARELPFAGVQITSCHVALRTSFDRAAVKMRN